MLVVYAHISVVPGCEAAFEETARRLCAATLAREPGVRRYEYVRLGEPSSYLATLAFDDHDAFIEHQASEHHHRLAGAMRELIAELRLERVEPVLGCSPLAPTEAMFAGSTAEVGTAELGPADDEVLAQRREHYRVRYPLARAAWWGEA